MHDGMPYSRNQSQGQGHSREVDRQSPTGLIFIIIIIIIHLGRVCSYIYLRPVMSARLILRLKILLVERRVKLQLL